MLKNKDFSPLHVHSEFSLLDGACKIKDLAAKAKKMHHRYIALTDHGSVDGIIRFDKACKENDIKPIFGCEIYLIDDFKNKDKKDKYGKFQRNRHLTVIAKNQIGLKAILKGLGWANINGVAKTGYASRPFFSLDYILENKDWHGNVIIQTGCGSSPFWNAKVGGELLQKYYDVFREDLYAELMPLHDFKKQYEINALALQAAKILDLKTIVTNDSHYLNKEDHSAHDVVLAIGQKGMTWNNPNRWKFDSHLNYLRDAQDVYQSLRKMGLGKKIAMDSVLNTMEVAEKCSFELKKIPVELPRVLPKGVDEIEYLTKTCYSEMKKRGFDKDKEYADRLVKELKAIIGGGFVRYLLLVADVINWAKNNDIEVGPGRGSSGGSLLCYLLHITEVDPIRFNLIFERFISVGRVDLPDIDIDFEKRKRHLIEKYLREKYGHWKVAHVSTFGAMKGKQVIRDVSRVFEVPRKEADTMSKYILVRPEMDSRASFSILDTVEVFEEAKKFNKNYPHVIKYASKIEGQIKSVGIHAAGFVVSRHDLRKSGNCHLVNRKGTLTVNWDKEDLEQMGLMKLDVLGLSTLSVLSECKTLIKKRHGVKIDYNNLPLDDKKTFDEVKQGNTVCAFQIGTKGIQKYCRDLKCDDFDTLVAASALWRPGCLKAGITQKFMECRLGRSKPEYFNDIHKSITETTYGQIIYQEQIMFLLYYMAGIPWDTTDQVRKVISKSEGVEKWGTYKEMYAKGCEKQGTMKYKEASDMFDNLRFFGQYSFNICFSPNEMVLLHDGSSKAAKDFKEGDRLICLGDSGPCETRLLRVYDQGEQDGYEMRFEDGTTFTCTKNHRLLTLQGLLPILEIVKKCMSVLSVSSSVKKFLDLRLREGIQNKIPMDNSQENLYSFLKEEEEKYKKKNAKNSRYAACPFNNESNGKKDFSETRHSGSKIGTSEALERERTRTIYGDNSERYRNESERWNNLQIKGRKEALQIAEALWFASRIGCYRGDQKGSRLYESESKNLYRIGRRWPFLSSYLWKEKFQDNSDERRIAEALLRTEFFPSNKNILWSSRQTSKSPEEMVNDIGLAYSKYKIRYCTFRKIISVTPVGRLKMLDFEVSHPSHNFILANGLVTSNSHAIEYGLISYWTMFLKCHYPVEFFCAYLNYGSVGGDDSSGEEKIDIIIKEAERYGIKILPPSVNKSGIGWSLS